VPPQATTTTDITASIADTRNTPIGPWCHGR
jgi:hypothetical protein